MLNSFFKLVSEPLFLNNQITTLLSQLGLPDSTFFALYNDEIKQLIFAFLEPAEALEVIKSQHKHLSKILCKCPHLLKEPFVVDLLKDLFNEKLGKYSLLSFDS